MMVFYEICGVCKGTGEDLDTHYELPMMGHRCRSCSGTGKIMTDALTIEDWFAGMALAGIMANPDWGNADAAWEAYNVAADMVAERERRRIGAKTHEDGSG